MYWTMKQWSVDIQFIFHILLGGANYFYIFLAPSVRHIQVIISNSLDKDEVEIIDTNIRTIIYKI